MRLRVVVLDLPQLFVVRPWDAVQAIFGAREGEGTVFRLLQAQIPREICPPQVHFQRIFLAESLERLWPPAGPAKRFSNAARPARKYRERTTAKAAADRLCLLLRVIVTRRPGPAERRGSCATGDRAQGRAGYRQLPGDRPHREGASVQQIHSSFFNMHRDGHTPIVSLRDVGNEQNWPIGRGVCE